MCVCVCKKTATISVENVWKNSNQTIQRNIWHVLSIVVQRCMLLNVHDTVFNSTLSALLFTFSFTDVPLHIIPFLFYSFHFSSLLSAMVVVVVVVVVVMLFLLQLTRSFTFCSFALSFIVLACNDVLRVRFDQCVMGRTPWLLFVAFFRSGNRCVYQHRLHCLNVYLSLNWSYVLCVIICMMESG